MIRRKVLLLTGGGMRCAWTGGLLYGLHELSITPDTIIAYSGSIGSATYFTSNQTENIKRIWTEHLPGNRFINFYRVAKIIDIDYLTDDVMLGHEPFDWNAVKASGTKLILPIHNADTDEVRIFTNTDVNYEVMRAGKALPIVYGKKVMIDGKYYRDYYYTCDQQLSYAQEGDMILFCNVGWQNKFSTFVRNHVYRNRDTEKIIRNVTFIEPRIDATLLTHSKKILTKTFAEGCIYAHEHKEFLTNFFKHD